MPSHPTSIRRTFFPERKTDVINLKQLSICPFVIRSLEMLIPGPGKDWQSLGALEEWTRAKDSDMQEWQGHIRSCP